VASRPALPDASRETPRPAGPTPCAPRRRAAAQPRRRLAGAPAAAARCGGATQPARPSLRDQIASLGSGRWADGQGSGKYTIDLDTREERFVDYLALLKRRIERVWQYPPEAANNGIGGDLLLVFT